MEFLKNQRFQKLTIIISLVSASILKGQQTPVYVYHHPHEGKVIDSIVEEFASIIFKKHGCRSSYLLVLSKSSSNELLYLRQFPGTYILDDDYSGVLNVIRVDSFFIAYDTAAITPNPLLKLSKSYKKEVLPEWVLKNEFICKGDSVSYLKYLNTAVSFKVIDNTYEVKEVAYLNYNDEKSSNGTGGVKQWFRRLFLNSKNEKPE